MIKTTVYLPEQLKHQLSSLAKRQQRSEAELIRSALESMLLKQEKRLPKSMGMVSDGTLQATDVKDWLRENWSPE